MGHLLYNILTSILLPLPLIVGSIVIGLGLRRIKPIVSGLILLVSLSALVTLSLPVTSARLISSLEQQNPPRQLSEVPNADLVVLLAGGVDIAKPPRLQPELGARGDRLLTAVRLLNANKSERIIIAGNARQKEVGIDSEAQATRNILIELGIEPARILKAVTGRNTRETAEFAAHRLQQLEVNKMLLVTSAYHMPRSLQLFENLAPEVIPVTSNHLIAEASSDSIEDWIPSAVSLSGSTLAINEYLGMLVNRWLPPSAKKSAKEVN